ncbi:hypothetical protein ES703_18847 [subsurface metagenome]
MQWLIDIVKKWIWIRSNLPPGYVDRGDPVNYDFTEANLTTDSAWHVLDLSAIIPNGATAVLLSVKIRCGLAGIESSVRKNGNVNVPCRSSMYTQVANLYNLADWVVTLNSNRKIEYFFTNVVWTNIFIIVRGWWF